MTTKKRAIARSQHFFSEDPLVGILADERHLDVVCGASSETRFKVESSFTFIRVELLKPGGIKPGSAGVELAPPHLEEGAGDTCKQGEEERAHHGDPDAVVKELPYHYVGDVRVDV